MILLLIILPLVMSCPAPPTTTTTTTTRRPGMLTIPERSTYEVASSYGNSMYPDCPKFFSDCRIVQLNDSALQLMTWNWNADFSFRVSSKWMHLDINKTHELDKYFLTYFSVSILTKMLSIEACRQTVLPDRSLSYGQKLVGNAKNQKFKCDILSDFQMLDSVFSRIFCTFYVIFTHRSLDILGGFALRLRRHSLEGFALLKSG